MAGLLVWQVWDINTMRSNKSFNKVLELTETALATPEIKKDKNLCEILEKVKASAAKGEFYYDYKKEFQPAISGFTIRNGFSTPKVLLELLAEVKTPKEMCIRDSCYIDRISLISFSSYYHIILIQR